MFCYKCNHKLPDDSEFCQYCGNKIEETITTSNEIVIENSKKIEAPNELVSNNHSSTSAPVTRKEKTIKNKYCSRCGSLIDNETKKCIGCGKQYFRGFRFTKFSIAIIAFMLVITTVSSISVLQYMNVQKLKNEIKELKDEINTLEEYGETKQSKINILENEISALESNISDYLCLADFIDNYVVFVEDDGSGFYHKFECYRFKGNSFWVYNLEAAIQFDYSPCPYCH